MCRSNNIQYSKFHTVTCHLGTESKGATLLTQNFGTRKVWVVNSMPQLLYPQEIIYTAS